MVSYLLGGCYWGYHKKDTLPSNLTAPDGDIDEFRRGQMLLGIDRCWFKIDIAPSCFLDFFWTSSLNCASGGSWLVGRKWNRGDRQGGSNQFQPLLVPWIHHHRGQRFLASCLERWEQQTVEIMIQKGIAEQGLTTFLHHLHFQWKLSSIFGSSSVLSGVSKALTPLVANFNKLLGPQRVADVFLFMLMTRRRLIHHPTRSEVNWTHWIHLNSLNTSYSNSLRIAPFRRLV